MRLGKRPKKASSRQKNGSNTLETVSPIGRVSCDMIATFIPQIEKLAIESMERYANEYVLYNEALQNLSVSGVTSEAEISADGSIRTNQEIPMPPKKPLFYSENQLTRFKKTLIESSDHFFTEKGGWRIQANAAKFERLLDERYGIFRPFITSHPEIDHFIRSLQRKYAMGYFSPFRQSPPPISRGNAIVLLFMMKRGKVSWQILILIALFLLIGLQPWALVTIITLVQFLFMRRKHRVLGKMKRHIPTVKSYFRIGVADSKLDNESLNNRKRELLLQNVGTPLEIFEKSHDITDTSNFDVIMRGSGAGTLYAAALLARAGKKVLVLSPMNDASGCLKMTQMKDGSISDKLKNIPFDVECCNISKITRQQQLMAPALCTDNDYQGGIRFAQIGCEDDGYAFEILSVPGLGSEPSEQIPFVICASGGLQTLMDQTANSLGDGWSDGQGGVGQSVTGAYVTACEAMNATSSAYYLSKLLPESVNKLRSDSSYHDCAVRPSSSFLNRVFPLNVHTRSLMAAIGMKNENLQPCSTSMAAHVTNVCATLSGEGMHYPIGGPRALCQAFVTVIEQNGGQVITNVHTNELLFDESITVEKQQSSEKNDSEDDGPPPPSCVGVKLQNNKEIRFATSRYTRSKDDWPVVISTEGFIQTFIRMLSDDIRTKYKVPRGLPALSERRPVMYILFALKGNANDLNLTGADFFRLPGAAIARDEVDPVTGEIKFGEIGWSEDGDVVEDEKLQKVIESLVNDTEENKIKEESKAKDSTSRKKMKAFKFASGSSWMRISFPSAKDPSFESRHRNVSTCVVTIEADDDFVMSFDTKPKIYVTKKNSPSMIGDCARLHERVKKDLLDMYPQLEGKIVHSEIQGPYNKGLRQNPERYTAKGIRPDTPYPGLFVGGCDLTVDTFAGSIVAGWLVANSVAKYQAVDHLFLSKNITTDIEQFLEPPIIPEVEDVAVPFPENSRLDNTNEET